MLLHLEVCLWSLSCGKNQWWSKLFFGFWKKKINGVTSKAPSHPLLLHTSVGNHKRRNHALTFSTSNRHPGWNQKSLDPSDQSRDFHCSNLLSLCFLAQTFLFSCWSSSAEVSLQLFDHKGLIQAVFSDDSATWTLSSISVGSNLSCWEFVVSEAVALMSRPSAAKATWSSFPQQPLLLFPLMVFFLPGWNEEP